MGKTSVRGPASAVRLICALLAAALLGVTAAHATTRRVTGPIPVSSQSQPLGTAFVPASPGSVDLAARGYVEEEFFVSGEAALYRRGTSGRREVLRSGVPYVTRMLVRRPADPARFSGVVHVEPMHPQLGSTTTWPAAADYVLRSGDAYVALGLGADANTRTLSRMRGVPIAGPLLVRAFDPERYDSLTWPEDDGARWDVIGDLLGVLRNGGHGATRVLGGARARRVFASGWSFSGSLWRTYIAEGFDADARRAGIGIDGYLIGISSRWNGGGYLPLNAEEPVASTNSPRRALPPIEAPVIEFITEHEVLSGSGPQLPDVDSGRGRHRLYELGGTIHGDGFVADQGRTANALFVQLQRRGYPIAAAQPEYADPEECRLAPSDVPIGAYATAMLDALKAWREGARVPPRAAPIEVTTDGRVVRDAAGNPLGGIRVAEFDVPLASYGPPADGAPAACRRKRARPAYFRQPLDAAALRARYGTPEAYLQQWQARTDALVRDGWLLAPEAAALRARAGERAAAQFAPAAAPRGTFGNYRPAPRFHERLVRTFYHVLRDGTRVAVAVARPAENGEPIRGRFPVIWHHTLSVTEVDANGTGGRQSAYRRMTELTDQGYVVVQVARRGNGQSFGARRGYHERNEAGDAYEITEYLAREPYSDGNVAIYGCSNTGEAAMHALTARPPHLKAVWAGCFSWDKYDGMRRGGVMAQWGTGPTRSVEEDMRVPPVRGDDDRRQLAQAVAEHQLSTPLLDLWSQMPYRDSLAPAVHSRFWGEGSVSRYADAMRVAGVPLYVQGGWRDEFRDQGLTAFLNLRERARIVIGDWLHCENDDFTLQDEMLRFFDRHLKGLENGLDADAPVHYFTVNAPTATAWRSADAWPIKGVSSWSLYLRGDGALDPVAPRATVQPTAFDVDYGVKCAHGGEGSRVQPCHVPGQGASFATRPAERDIEITGDAVAELWVAADAADAQVFAYLEDVAPDGTVRIVTEGRLRASLRAEHLAPWAMPPVPWHRAYAEDSRPLEPGVPVRLRFGLNAASWLLRAGHRVQLTVTGADHRERLRPSAVLPRRLTVLHDAAHRSVVRVPVVGER